MNDNTGFLDALRRHLPEYMAQRGQVLGRKNKLIRCINPEHRDSTPSMNYLANTCRLYCFGCGARYDVFDVIGLDYPDCDTFKKRVARACELFGYAVPESFSPQSELPQAAPARSQTPGIAAKSAAKNAAGSASVDKTEAALTKESGYNEWIEQGIAECGIGGNYFARRGITPQLCERFKLFESQGRAVMPVINGGVCTCYCARALHDSVTPRYKNSAGVMELFGADYLTGTGRGGALFVTESVFDALSVEQCGFQAVALCGAANVRRFIETCAQNPAAARSYCIFAAGDNDGAGQRMNSALIEGLGRLGVTCEAFEIPFGCKDMNEALVKDYSGLRAALAAAGDAGSASYLAQNACACLDSLLDGSGVCADAIPTGFEALDSVLDGGLYPGLYILGAVSSVGKTSFVLQLADNIAASGGDVLFFSLEMSRRELVAKSLSRLSKAVTSRQALRGQFPASGKAGQAFSSAVASYRGFAKNIFLREGLSDVDVREVAETLKSHVRYRGKKPVVFIDYLQILRPLDFRSTEKQNMDRAVVELKRISRDFDVPVFALSSFNRDSYRSGASMEAFKESGALEYSSDVLLGLQLAGVGESGFNADAARKRSPRKMELVLLKNRNGISHARLPFDYDARHSFFSESSHAANK